MKDVQQDVTLIASGEMLQLMKSTFWGKMGLRFQSTKSNIYEK